MIATTRAPRCRHILPGGAQCHSTTRHESGFCHRHRAGTWDAAVAVEPREASVRGVDARRGRRMAAVSALRRIATMDARPEVKADQYRQVFGVLPDREVCELVVVLAEHVHNGPEAAANWHIYL